MAFPYAEIESFTHNHIIPNIKDNIYLSNKLCNRLIKNNRLVIDGGIQIERPVEFEKADGGTHDGKFKVVGYQEKKLVDKAILQWKYLEAHQTITKDDEVKNAGGAKAIDLINFKWSSMKKKLVDLIGDGIYSANADGAEGITGLRLMIGIANTYAGIDQSTYTDWWYSQVDSTTSTLTLPKMEELYVAIANASSGQIDTADGGEPTDIVTTSSVFGDFWKLTQPQQQFSSIGDQAKVGWTSMLFNGKPVYFDSKCTASHMFMLNLNDIQMFISEKCNFEYMPWTAVPNQPFARLANVKLALNMIGNPKVNGMMSGLSSRVS